MADEAAAPASNDAFRRFFAISPRYGFSQKLGQSIADEIAERIFDSRMKPGDPLPTESVMIERFGVSRATLREALRLLETQGIIQMRTGRGRGPVVSSPSAESLARTLSVSFRAIGLTFEEVLITRNTIEPALAREAALRRTDADLEVVLELMEQMEAAPSDAVVYSQLNSQFHNALAMASNNRPLAVLWSAISNIADGQGIGAEWNADIRRETNRAHRRIFEAIAAGDSAAAERAMSRHVHAFHEEVAQNHPEMLRSPVKLFRQTRLVPDISV